MKDKTRKLIFTAAAAILISLLLTCIPLGPPDDYEDFVLPEFTDVEYSPDGSSVTIYLDGSAPVRHTRALTLESAKLGHDLFEVAFFHPVSGVIARAVWETGHAAGVSGVYRGVSGAGVDYRYATIPAIPDATDSGQGAAILFVGKKSDRTLLAVGSLTHVNNGAGTVLGTTVTADTRSVTFSVAALKTGVNSRAASSCFKTDALDRGGYANISELATDVKSVTIGSRPFPLFRVVGNSSPGFFVYGSYQFDVVTGDFNTKYRNGIIQKSNTVVRFPAEPQQRIPRYPKGNDQWETAQTGSYKLDVDNIVGNLTQVIGQDVTTNIGNPVVNPIQFRIGPTISVTGETGKVFAFTFEIEVYPLTGAGNRDDGFSWYLRPGYDSYMFDLDDGVGNGGAILIGTGEFEETLVSSLIVRQPPTKTKYNGTDADTGDALGPYDFDIGGLEVYRQNLGSSPNLINLTDPLDPLLYFVVDTADGPKAILPGQNIQPILAPIAALNNGIVKVHIEYYGPPVAPDTNDPIEPPYKNVDGDIYLEKNNSTYNTGDPPYYNGGDPLTGELIIYYFDLPSNMEFEVSGSYIITNNQDWIAFQNGPVNTAAGIYIVVFFKNFNIDYGLTNLNGGRTIIMLAAEPDVIVGKTVPNVFQDNSTAGSYNTYYFGVWPFDETLVIEGKAIESQPFIINGGGTYDVVTFDPITGAPSAPPGTGSFITGGGTYKIVNDMGVTVLNTLY